MVAQTKYKISIVGVNGRMGRTVKALLENHSKGEFYKGFGQGDIFDFEDADAVIDFSAPTAFPFYKDALKGKPLVIGTTAIAPDVEADIIAQAEKSPIYYSSNMSLGIFVINKFIETFKDFLNEHFDAAISDIHHTQKKDSPSGTALMLEKAFGRPVPISSERLSNVCGIHTINLASQDEMISITHTAFSRDIFAHGAIHAALSLLENYNGQHH